MGSPGAAQVARGLSFSQPTTFWAAAHGKPQFLFSFSSNQSGVGDGCGLVGLAPLNIAFSAWRRTSQDQASFRHAVASQKLNSWAQPVLFNPTSRIFVHSISRNTAIALFVVLLHAGFVYVLLSGLLMRAVERLVPVVVMAQFIEPLQPRLTSPLPVVPPADRQPVKQSGTKAPAVAPPLPRATADPVPIANAPTGAVAPQPVPPLPSPSAPASPATSPALSGPPSTAPVTAAVSATARPAPVALQLPSTDADYLQNPRPPYPPVSRRLNEQGRTTVRVLIGVDGRPQSAEVAKSSGYVRLDNAAVATVMGWRYVPGKRGGVAEAMWFDVPIDWAIE